MAGWSRLETAALLIALATGASRVDAQTKTATIRVYLDNKMAVPEGDVSRARGEVERIFVAAGFEIAWSSTLQEDPRPFTVTLVELVDPANAPAGCTLGLAIASHHLAYVFYSRIAYLARTQPLDVDIVLGRVIAHELGHLLLRPGRHSADGIMRGNLDFRTINPARFNGDQVRQMRGALSEDGPSDRARRTS